MAKSRKQTLDEGAQMLNRFAEGIRDKAPIDEPVKPRTLNKRKDTILDLRREFILDRKGKMSSDRTIGAYETNFNRLQDFIGFHQAEYTTKPTCRGEWYDYDESYRNVIREIGGKTPIEVLETPNFMAYFVAFLKEVMELSEQTILSTQRHVRAIIYFAQENKWISDYKVKVKDIKPPVKSTYTVSEIQRLIRTPKSNDFVEWRNWLMIKYMSATGNRIGSILSLKVEDIDFDNNTIRVQVAKNREPKNYRMNPQLRLPLKRFINDFHRDEEGNILLDRYLFSNRFGGKLDYGSCRQAMMRYFDARKVAFGGFHKFRYTYASAWIRDGGNPLDLKEQLGHSSLTMTNRYVQDFGTTKNSEIDKHSLIAKVQPNAGRKTIKKRDD